MTRVNLRQSELEIIINNSFIQGLAKLFYQLTKKLGTVRDGPGSDGQKTFTRTSYV